jgi:oligoribonuclease NrnB/cAMP/cGMP phosphodiesterase (DHH superfamily)
MKYDIYFHNDFDGRASAAVMLAFLRSCGDQIAHFTPVNYDLTQQWLDPNFFKKHKLFKGPRNPAIIVDFIYHPAAAFWFDHHPTTFKRDDWRKKFKPDKFHQLQPHYLSNCHLTYTALKQDFGWKPEKHFVELVKWLDVIDGARYRSSKQTLELKEPALEVDAFIDETDHNKKETVAIIKLLSEKPLSTIAKMPKVQKAARTMRKSNIKGLSFYRKNMKVFDDVTLIDLSSTDIKSLRYAPYYLRPKILYGMRITRRDGLYHIGIGANPWIKGAALKKHRDVHIGELLKKYGGGGHKGAGAGEFKTMGDVQRAVAEMIPALNK